MYTGSKPRRQSDKSPSTICASFPLARVNAHGGAVGGQANIWSKVKSGVRGVVVSDIAAKRNAFARLPSQVFARAQTRLSQSCEAQARRLELWRPTGADGSHGRPDPCRPAPAP